MRLAAVVLLFTFFFFKAAAQPFPRKAADVVPAFYELYDVAALPVPKIQWEKRNHSWYVYELDPDSGQSVHLNRQLFYDANTGNLVPLDYKKRDTGKTTEDANALLNGEAYNFDVQPSYGYPGWYKDVIGMYAKSDSLPVDETYSLARAYSAAAAARLSTQFGDALPEEIFTTALRPNCLTEAQVDTYLALANNAIALFDAVAAREPAFQTRVGSIQRKAANERLVALHHLLVYAGNHAGKLSLPDNLYEPALLDSIKGVIGACPRNAVFLSFGDNDFYPVLYLQAKGFRRDVHLANISLLGLDRYIYFASTQRWFDAAPLSLSLDTAQYKGNANLYRLLKKAAPLPVNRLVAALKTLPPGADLPSDKWIIRGQPSKTKLAKRYRVEITAQYIVKEEMVLLDLLNRLNGRAFCCVSPFGPPVESLNAAFRWNGMLFVYGR